MGLESCRFQAQPGFGKKTCARLWSVNLYLQCLCSPDRSNPLSTKSNDSRYSVVMTDIEKLKRQHDMYQSALWEMAAIIGFRPGENPSRVQLIARLKARLEPYNEKHGIPTAVATALATPVYRPSPPAYSPNAVPLSKKVAASPVQLKRKTPAPGLSTGAPPPLPNYKRTKSEPTSLAVSLKGLLDGIATTEPF